MATKISGGGECITSGNMIEKGSLESYKYYFSRRTVLEMLKDRGFVVPDSELDRSLIEFLSDFGNKPDLERLRLCFPLRSNPSKKMLVVYSGTEEISTQVIRNLHVQILIKESLHGLILILQTKMNPYAGCENSNAPKGSSWVAKILGLGCKIPS